MSLQVLNLFQLLGYNKNYFSLEVSFVVKLAAKLELPTNEKKQQRNRMEKSWHQSYEKSFPGFSKNSRVKQ